MKTLFVVGIIIADQPSANKPVKGSCRDLSAAQERVAPDYQRGISGEGIA
jgi:hypothetical protein